MAVTSTWGERGSYRGWGCLRGHRASYPKGVSSSQTQRPAGKDESLNVPKQCVVKSCYARVQSQKEGWGLPQNWLPPCLREPRVCSGAQKDSGTVRTCCCEMGTSTTGKPYMFLSHREGGTASRPPCSSGERTDTPTPAPCSLQLVFHYTRPMPTRGTVCKDALASLAAKKLSCLM